MQPLANRELLDDVMSRNLCRDVQEGPDSLVGIAFVNGRIRTLDPHRPMGNALAVAAGTIVAVGTDEEIMALSTTQTRIVDFGGRAVLPGPSILSQIHVSESASGFQDDALAAILAAAAPAHS